jgi:hypothetical protein
MDNKKDLLLELVSRFNEDNIVNLESNPNFSYVQKNRGIDTCFLESVYNAISTLSNKNSKLLPLLEEYSDINKMIIHVPSNRNMLGRQVLDNETLENYLERQEKSGVDIRTAKKIINDLGKGLLEVIVIPGKIFCKELNLPNDNQETENEDDFYRFDNNVLELFKDINIDESLDNRVRSFFINVITKHNYVPIINYDTKKLGIVGHNWHSSLISKITKSACLGVNPVRHYKWKHIAKVMNMKKEECKNLISSQNLKSFNITYDIETSKRSRPAIILIKSN